MKREYATNIKIDNFSAVIYITIIRDLYYDYRENKTIFIVKWKNKTKSEREPREI